MVTTKVAILKRNEKRQQLRHFLQPFRHLVQIAVALLYITPLLIMISGAFRPDAETFRYSGTLSLWTFLPRNPTLDAFYLLSEREFFFIQLGNTAFLGFTLASSATLVAILAAYPFARLQFPGRNSLFFIMVATLFLPLDVIIAPIFLVVQGLSLDNSFWGLFLPWVFSPLAVYLLRQTMLEIPQEIQEAAIIDGANPLHLLWHIIVPNVIPAIVTVWLLNFISVWDWFLWPLVVTQDPNNQVVQVDIVSMFSNPMLKTNYPLVFCASLIAVAPVFAVFFTLQRFFIQTITFSGGK